jgi:uncharacterized iron-regulated membrane protein
VYLLEIFGGLALLLCVAGLYGLLAYVVSRRTRELTSAQRSGQVFLHRPGFS